LTVLDAGKRDCCSSPHFKSTTSRGLFRMAGEDMALSVYVRHRAELSGWATGHGACRSVPERTRSHFLLSVDVTRWSDKRVPLA